ncbi:MAG: rubrerythrin family protein [Spirochaetes bacterium]|nr:rubrerythrin family protein [Spirochaetota bacterium]
MRNRHTISLLLSALMVIAFGCKKSSPADKTIENLKAAISGETTASAKYSAYSKKAKEEGLTQIALLFDATSRAESIHAKRDLEVLDQLRQKMNAVNPKFEIKSTKENLEDAIKGESHEIESMYPGFIKTAEEAKIDAAVTSFNYAFETEKRHLGLYKDALSKLEKKDMKGIADSYAICPKCGNSFAKNGPATCDICGEARVSFLIIK